MSMSKDNFYSASDFIALKQRVKNEMLRRNGNGDLSIYGGSSYDYIVIPSKDMVPKLEHFNKIRDLMANINSTTVALAHKNTDNLVSPMDVLQANMTVFEGKSRGERSTSDCGSACTGMCISQCTTSCVGGCTGSCSGCSGSCSGSCNGSCNSGCNTTCTVQCGNNCTGGCINACTSCDTACNLACASCTYTCTASCANNCSSTCTGGSTTGTVG